MATKYIIRDWSTIKDMRNELNDRLRTRASIYYDPETQEPHGYTIDVYVEKNHNDNCNCISLLYKVDVDCDLPAHYSMTTNEAIEFLNLLGFNCEFDYSVFPITDKVREQLTNLSSLGYKTVVRVVRPWSKIFVTTKSANDISMRTTYPQIGEFLKQSLTKDTVCPDIINYRDYLFLPPNTPTPIEEILKTN